LSTWAATVAPSPRLLRYDWAVAFTLALNVQPRLV
jgi:hypothetical protein